MPRKSRFSEKQIADMVQRYLNGETSTTIGNDYGIHRASVYDLLKARGVEMRSVSQAKKMHSCREDAFVSVKDESTAYWFGFLCADGCIWRKKSNTFYTSIALKESDIEHLEAFSFFMNATQPILFDPKSKSARITIVSEKLYYSLNALGCTPRKSLTLQFPNLPPEILPHFVRGYFDGDGSAYVSGNTPNISFAGNQKFLGQLKAAIETHTHKEGRLSPHSKSSIWYLFFRGKSKVTPVKDWLYRGATVWLDRKRSVLERYVEAQKGL